MTSTTNPRSPSSRFDSGSDANAGWSMAEAMIRRWRLLVVIPLAFAVVAWGTTFLIASKYTAVTSFVTGSREQAPNLGAFASVASQLGVGLSASPTNSPQFYADVLRSREILTDVLRANVPNGPKPTDSARVVDLFVKRSYPEDVRLERGLTELSNGSAVSVNPRTNIIELKVTSKSAVASAGVAKRFLIELNRFNLEKRRSQARERRVFLEARLRETQDSLRQAQAMLEGFLESNRQFTSSPRFAPSLQTRHDAIQRQISLYTETYGNFRRDLETARVDEVNDTPVITVIDSAVVPLKRSSPSRSMSGILGGTLGILVAVIVLLAGASLERLRETDPENHARLLELRRTFLGTLRRSRSHSAP